MQHEQFTASLKSISPVNFAEPQRQLNYPYKELDFWEPQLRKMRAHGMVHSEKFSWPNNTIIKELDLTQVIKLCGIELGMTSNLFQIRLHFTSGLRSPIMRAESAGVL